MQPPTNDIGYAIKALKAGKQVARRYWTDSGTWLEMVNDIIYTIVAGERMTPWTCPQTDLLAEDWYIVYEKVIQD